MKRIQQPLYSYMLKYQHKTRNHFSDQLITGKELLRIARAFFEIDDGHHKLINAKKEVLSLDDKIHAKSGPFELVSAATNLAPFSLTTNVYISMIEDYCRQIYISIKNADNRRAYSLLRWRCIYLPVILDELLPPELQDFLNEFQQDSDLMETNVDVPNDDRFKEQCQLNTLLEERVASASSDLLIPCFFCKLAIAHFQYSSNSKTEIQFHSLWKDVIFATIGQGCTSSFALFWEYCIGKFIPGYKSRHYVDLVLFCQAPKFKFPVLFVEVAGTLIRDADDHKDFQKMISDMALCLLQLIMLLRDHPVSRLQQLRVFGIFITRFAYDFVCIRPFFSDGNVTSVGFIVETTPRANRRHLVVDNTISRSQASSSGATEDPREVSLEGKSGEQLQQVALDVDIERPLEENEDVANDPSIGGKIQTTLNDWNIELAKPLLAFGMKMQTYSEQVKDLFDCDFAEALDVASAFPKPATGRRTSSSETPISERRSLSSASRYSLRSSEMQFYSHGLTESVLSSLNGFDIHCISERDGVIVLSFASKRFPTRVLKCSSRSSAQNEFNIVSKLPDYRFIPFTYCSDFFSEKGGTAFWVLEHLVCKHDVGTRFLDRFRHWLDFMGDCLEALEYLRSNRVVHRDISPSNIMYSIRDCRYKLIDMDSACVIPIGCDSVQCKDELFGTKGYLDPEISRTRRYSFDSDLWSLGKVAIDNIIDDLSMDMDSEYPSHSPMMALFDEICGVALSMMDVQSLPTIKDLIGTISTLRMKVQLHERRQSAIQMERTYQFDSLVTVQ